METTATETKNGSSTKKSIDNVEEQVHNVEVALQERVAQVSDIVEDVRDRVEMAIHERPYIVPVAAGALGLGVGVLIGSKLTRVIALGFAGALLNDAVRGQIVNMTKDFVKTLADKMDEESGEDVEAAAE